MAPGGLPRREITTRYTTRCILTTLLLLTSACVRTAWRPATADDCIRKTSIELQFAAESLRALRGEVVERVVDRDGTRIVPDAQIQVTGEGVLRETVSERDGTFRLDSVGSGRVESRVRRVSYAGRGDTLDIPSYAGLLLTVPLRFLPLDECPGSAHGRVWILEWPWP